MDQITLSRNELSALLTRACEAYYGVEVDYNALAVLILNAHCHGLFSIEQFCHILSQEERIKYAEPFGLTQSDAGTCLQQHCTDEFYAALWAVDYITVLKQREAAPQYSIDCLCEGHLGRLLDFMRAYETGISEGDMLACNIAAIENGITLRREQYKILNQIADEILVEATEESRKGAGE